jgi:hypothetical protein
MNRKRLLTAAVGTLVATVIAGGVAYATIPGPDKVYSACMLKSLGTIRLIDKSLPATNPMSHCTDKETEVSWNQQGQQGIQGIPGPAGKEGAPGKDGTSVTNLAEPAGTNCPNGGASFTVGTGLPTFACSGKDGTNGTNGTNGTDGKDGAPGKDGASVTNVAELAGPNCPNGGSRFTVGTGLPTFACNGRDGTNGTIRQVSDTNTFYSTTLHQATATGTNTAEATAGCDSGEMLVGGGFSGGPGGLVSVIDSHPTAGGWYARGVAISGFGGTNISITAYALCAAPHTTIATTSVYGP